MIGAGLKDLSVVKKASMDSLEKTKDCDVSSSTSEDVSTCSDGSSQGSLPVNNCGESMEVTVTVISLDGVVAKKYQPKSKLPTKQKKTPKAVDTAASIVASFAQDLSNQKVNFFTHVPSLPIEMSESFSNSNPVIKWPNTSTEEKQVLSTVQLTREFQREKTSDENNTSSSSTNKNRFVPQMCPSNISISRHGRLINLGKASLFISGEERGDATINIPIFSSTHEDKSNAKKSSVKKVKGSKKSSTPMMRIKGDSLQFGLKSDAMLRILVSVTDVRVDGCEEETPSIEETKGVIEEPAACVTFNDDDCECVFDDDSIEPDDYEDYIGCIKAANESNELRSLRQQLRNSEDIIQSLQAEHETTRIAQQEEIERLDAKLKQATQNSESLLQELNQSKSQSEIVPFLETRINEFLEELKKKDTEIECLRDEVTEIRKYYKNQVNTLLWDAQDPDNTKAANWKAAIGSAALKATKHIRDREVEHSFSSQEEEKNDHSIEEPADVHLWDNQNSNDGNRAANWRAAIGTAALKARQHLLERENRQREGVEEITVISDEEKNNDTMEEHNASEENEEKSDEIVTTEEPNAGEKNECDEPLVDNSTEDEEFNGTVHNTGRAANWKNAIGSAFRRDINAEKVTVNDDSIVCQ
eukprot:scaffold8143_cov142-Skeletonema_marinoi.AAC.8